jgi:2-methylcitrate dehydratase PrpD
MQHFSYHSEQVHSTFENGKGQTRRNVVDIKNGKGTKAVEEYKPDGTRKNRKEKALTQKELECIKKGKFIPGLFKDCIKPLNLKTARKGKTKKRRNNH